MPTGVESPLYRIVRPCYRGVKRAYAGVRRRAVVLTSLARMELLSGSASSTPLPRRLWLWRHGPASRTESLFDLTPENRDEYQEGLTHGINGEWRRAMNNKPTARLLLQPFENRLLEFYGVVADGVARRYPAYESVAGDPARPPTDAAFEKHDALPYLDSLLDDADRVVCKPVFGAGGHGRVGPPLDNLHQGGLLVGVDRDTGELIEAASVSDAMPPFGVERFDAHPSTGERLAGRSMPNWDDIVEGVLHVASGLPQLRYVGWDVLPTDDGFRILEINSAPDVINPQIHCRLLNDPRVPRFYERHGVL